jgi:hypothetical protein
VPRIPAICTKCGNVFSSGVEFGPTASGTFHGSGSTCPKCGGFGVIPNGEYRTAGYAVSVIAHSARDEILLRRIQEVLQEAIRTGAPNKERFAKALKDAGVPNAAKIIEATPSGSGLYNWMMMVLAIIAIVLAAPAGVGDWKSIINDLSQSYPELRGTID